MSMKSMKVLALAVVLAFSFTAIAQAKTNPKKSTIPDSSIGSSNSTGNNGNGGNGPIGTPGSDKTIKAHVEALEKAVAALQATISGFNAAITALQTDVSTLKAVVSNQGAKITALQDQVDTLASNNALALGPYVSVDTGIVNGLAGPHILFTGANIHIQSGSGNTTDSGAPVGLGNLIIGYNEIPFAGTRGGSHNLVIGPEHSYSSTGGFVAGFNNIISGQSASVAGGEGNTASGNFSSVSGGSAHSATGTDNWSGGTGFSSPN